MCIAGSAKTKLYALPAYRVYRDKVDAFVQLIKTYEVGKHVDQKLKIEATARMVGLEVWKPTPTGNRS